MYHNTSTTHQLRSTFGLLTGALRMSRNKNCIFHCLNQTTYFHVPCVMDPSRIFAFVNHKILNILQLLVPLNDEMWKTWPDVPVRQGPKEISVDGFGQEYSYFILSFWCQDKTVIKLSLTFPQGKNEETVETTETSKQKKK